MKPDLLSCNNAVRAGQFIDAYFTYIEGEYHIEQKPVKVTKDHVETVDQKIWDRPPEPATISGLAFYLGFNSRDELEAYRTGGAFADVLKRAVLRIEASYEVALHQNATGAMFALKSIGWNEKPPQPAGNAENNNILKVEIINTGPPPAGNEKDVSL
ncbi:terminase small subunit [Mucilaginibacter celer]|nr:terminase small subunit [Mucilaginibacter celer]